MKPEDISSYLRENYSRIDNLLLTLVSCSLIMDNESDRGGLSPGSQIVAETLHILRESMTEQELLSVSMLLAEIQRLSDDD